MARGILGTHCGLYFDALKSVSWRHSANGVFGTWRLIVQQIAAILLQHRVLRLGLLQDGDVGVGVFPDFQEFFIALPGGCIVPSSLCSSSDSVNRFRPARCPFQSL